MGTTSAGVQAGPRLQAWPRWFFALMAAVAGMAVCAWFYPPRLAVFEKKDVRLQEWARAESFLRQCENPWRRDVEPAMRWRLLPPLVCHALNLRGGMALLIPWLGLAALLAALAARLDVLTGRRELAAWGTLGFATTGGPITMVNWLGLNDGWCLLALLETAAGRSRPLLVLCGLLGPWIDERYLIGLPLALFVRWRLGEARRRETGTGFDGDVVTVVLAAVPYLAIRSWSSLRGAEAVSADYVRAMIEVFKYYALFVPLGWFMGLRALWWPLASGGAGARRAAIVPVLLAFATMAVLAVLAWDLSRSTSILLPVFVLALTLAAKRPEGPRIWRWAVFANLCLPYAHVVGPTLTWNHGPFGCWNWLVP